MVKYECFRCGYSTNHRGNVQHHLNRKNMCNPTEDNVEIEEIKKYYGFDCNTPNLHQNTTILPQNTTILPQNNTIINPQNTTLLPQNTTLLPQNTTFLPQNIKQI